MDRIKKIILFLIMMIAVSSLVFAENVLVVLSSENKVYKETAAGFEKRIADKGVTINKTEYVLTGNSEIPIGNNNIVYAIGASAYDAAKKTVKTIPIVFSLAFVDPVKHSGSESGITLSIPPEKSLEKMKEFLPGKTKLGIIYSAASLDSFDKINSNAGKYGFTVVGLKVSGADGFDAAFNSIKASIDSYMMLPDSGLYSSNVIKMLLTASIADKIPVVGLSSIYTRAGAYISFDYDYTDIGIQSGELVVDVLSGKNKGKVLYPRNIKISINETVANAQGLGSMVMKADDIFGR